MSTWGEFYHLGQEVAAKSAIRYENFAREYVIDLNATRAAIAAGYKVAGAHVRGAELVKNRKVQAIIGKLQAKRASKLEIKADKVMEELARLGFANMWDYLRVDVDGKPALDLTNLTRDQAAAIQEIREDATGGAGDGERKLIVRTTFKLADKRSALELIGNHLGMWQDNMKVSGLENLVKVLSEKEDGSASTDSRP